MKQIIAIDNLSVELQSKTILSGVSFTMNAGDILGLVGPSGCGKTTLLNAIAGFVDMASGSINIAEQETITPKRQIPAEKRQLGVIFQDYALFPHLSVEQNIAFGIQRLAKATQRQRIQPLLELFELTPYVKRFPHELSGGQQQRVAIARALAVQPKVLLLDEPFSNIDARLRNALMLELRQLLKSLGMSAIFVTHNKDEVFTFADKMAVLHQGKLLQVGTPAEIFAQPANWQVADFLQIGSWLPVVKQEQSWVTALGALANEKLSSSENSQHELQQLLVKPNVLSLDESGEKNCQVDLISATEQGFHYLLSSLNNQQFADELSFSGLSFYSEEVLSVGQKVSLHISPHHYQLFTP